MQVKEHFQCVSILSFKKCRVNAAVNWCMKLSFGQLVLNRLALGHVYRVVTLVVEYIDMPQEFINSCGMSVNESEFYYYKLNINSMENFLRATRKMF